VGFGGVGGGGRGGGGLGGVWGGRRCICGLGPRAGKPHRDKLGDLSLGALTQLCLFRWFVQLGLSGCLAWILCFVNAK
jgi:hypothetical protein